LLHPGANLVLALDTKGGLRDNSVSGFQLFIQQSVVQFAWKAYVTCVIL
jgi:hypothetical protein